MNAVLNSNEDVLIFPKNGINSMLLLEVIEEKQQSIPQLKVVTNTTNNKMFRCKIYIDGEIASKSTYKQFLYYINNNQPVKSC